ncbi:MAG: hypothetical protein A2X61_16610 [Ignavibacteria bacterium GWB2_35_12]|nr:MAG: hypothetical protein A2X63_14135 [Ignavibacteria bacterium GWA2_35_8]OGU37890.1 MAG: hypothetical protein A2X61_16610 [Ignavibacteria bacterium GWB2_35_12]OGU85811.1 MAG: hypothetical protein A2220_02260 [Ignavibacteria bacterium RIFOXYA2_FULL_35_10]OGV19674.1 MAG: hypothetical protein A2475_10020 [Ignavibacteria bacterium RIFOXYC2_FULL_35_21]
MSLAEQLKLSGIVFNSGDIWFVPDVSVQFDEDQKFKKDRPVLIVMSKINIRVNSTILNIVPLSTQGKPERLRIPIAQGYSETFNGFVPDKNSLALVNFYRPIDKKYFKKLIGRIDDTCLDAIKKSICFDVVGYTDDFDLEP